MAVRVTFINHNKTIAIAAIHIGLYSIFIICILIYEQTSYTGIHNQNSLGNMQSPPNHPFHCINNAL